MPSTFFLLLPRQADFLGSTSSAAYAPLPIDDPEVLSVDFSEGSTTLGNKTKSAVSLTGADKWRLLRPMLLKYMLPLCERACVAS